MRSARTTYAKRGKTMNSEVTTQISGKDVLKAPETAVLVFILTLTFKTCNLPSVIFSASGESGIWAILIHTLLDGLLLGVSLFVASKGGIQSKSIPTPIRKIGAFLLLFFFLFKFGAFIYESTDSASKVLFENSLIFPIFAMVLIASAFIGSKGFSGIGRVALIFAWISIFILIFNLFFVGFDGFAYNLYPVLKFENVPKGILKEAVWFGEPLILMTADLSPKFTKKQTGHVIISFALAVVILEAFYLLMIYTYGEMSNSITNAFARVLTMNKYSNELGAVDWPIITVWLISAIIHTSCLFASCKQCFIEVVEKNGKNTFLQELIFFVLALGLPIIFYFTLFDNVTYTSILGSTAVGITCLIFSYVIPLIIAISAFVKKKNQKKDEKENEKEQSANS